eukprot:jgi/Mesvir1/3504/Mv11986-RA.1
MLGFYGNVQRIISTCALVSYCKLVLLSALYFVEGLPHGFQDTWLPLLFRSGGASIGAVSLLGLLKVPWLLKPLVSPLVDATARRCPPTRPDRTRARMRWIRPLQAALTLAFLGCACVFPAVFPAPGITAGPASPPAPNCTTLTKEPPICSEYNARDISSGRHAVGADTTECTSQEQYSETVQGIAGAVCPATDPCPWNTVTPPAHISSPEIPSSAYDASAERRKAVLEAKEAVEPTPALSRRPGDAPPAVSPTQAPHARASITPQVDHVALPHGSSACLKASQDHDDTSASTLPSQDNNVASASFIPPQSSRVAFAGFLLLANTAAATMDVAVDSMAVDVLATPHERGWGNAAQVVGFKAGMLFSSAVFGWSLPSSGALKSGEAGSDLGGSDGSGAFCRPCMGGSDLGHGDPGSKGPSKSGMGGSDLGSGGDLGSGVVGGSDTGSRGTATTTQELLGKSARRGGTGREGPGGERVCGNTCLGAAGGGRGDFGRDELGCSVDSDDANTCTRGGGSITEDFGSNGLPSTRRGSNRLGCSLGPDLGSTGGGSSRQDVPKRASWCGEGLAGGQGGSPGAPGGSPWQLGVFHHLAATVLVLSLASAGLVACLMWAMAASEAVEDVTVADTNTGVVSGSNVSDTSFVSGAQGSPCGLRRVTAAEAAHDSSHVRGSKGGCTGQEDGGGGSSETYSKGGGGLSVMRVLAATFWDRAQLLTVLLVLTYKAGETIGDALFKLFLLDHSPFGLAAIGAWHAGAGALSFSIAGSLGAARSPLAAAAAGARCAGWRPRAWSRRRCDAALCSRRTTSLVEAIAIIVQ